MTLPATRFDFTAQVPAAQELGRVHLVAVGGAGMSGLARILRAKGLAVSGSDVQDSPVLRALAAEGVRVQVGHDPAYLAGADTVVVSSAVRETNPELAAARARGLPVLHRAQALASAMGGSRRVAIAGANGKTTTTSMLVEALQACGVEPSFAVGGELAQRGTNAGLGTGEIFVVEADESDGSFLVYRPHVAVVTSVQPDHLDFFGDVETLEAAYRAFVGTIPAGGVLVACADDAGARRLTAWAAGRPVRVVTYGESADADVRVTDVSHRGLQTRATVALRGVAHDLHLQVPGRHNVLNAAAALAVAVVGLCQPAAATLEGLGSYTGTRRRFEVLGRAGGVHVVDDYAHNPGKVAAVVGAGRDLVADAGSGRLVVIFQPHLYSRTRDFAGALGESLAPADVVVVMDVYAAREDPEPAVTGELVSRAVVAARPDAQVHYVPARSAVADTVLGLLRPGDLVLTVGAGDVTTIGPQLLQALGAGPSPSAGDEP